MKYINDSKYILFILVSSLSILFSETSELFSTQHVNYKIEVGIESITKSNKPVVTGNDGLKALDVAIQIQNQIKNKN